jgi:hypothetical protein
VLSAKALGQDLSLYGRRKLRLSARSLTIYCRRRTRRIAMLLTPREYDLVDLELASIESSKKLTPTCASLINQTLYPLVTAGVIDGQSGTSNTNNRRVGIG